jgi:hypothetical protein
MLVIGPRSKVLRAAAIVVTALFARGVLRSVTLAPVASPIAPLVVLDDPASSPIDAPARPWRDAERCPDGYTNTDSAAHWSSGRCRVGPVTFEQRSIYGVSRWSAGAFECGVGSPGVPEELGTRFEYRAHRDLGVYEYRCVGRGDGHVERYRRVRVRSR